MSKSPEQGPGPEAHEEEIKKARTVAIQEFHSGDGSNVDEILAKFKESGASEEDVDKLRSDLGDVFDMM